MQNELEVGVFFAVPEAEKFGLPIYRNAGDAGADLHVVLSGDELAQGYKTIYPDTRELLDTGIHLELPTNYYARIVHRSSTERRLRLRVVEGTIDTGYIGRIFVQVANTNSFPIDIKHGERVAQLILTPVVQAQFKQISEMKPTQRGTNGFGSTGAGAINGRQK